MNHSECPATALLLISFGGPTGPDDVVPFLENVARGKNIPRERLLEVAGHYERFGGVSPINAQNQALLTALLDELNCARAAALGLLGQSQLASAPGRHGALHGRRRRASCSGVRHVGVRLVSRLPAIYRGHRACPTGGRTRRAANRQAAIVLQSSGLHRRNGRSDRRGLDRSSGPAPPDNAVDFHGARHSGRRGRTIALPTAASRGVPACGGLVRHGTDGLESRVSEPERTAVAALAWPRPPRPSLPLGPIRRTTGVVVVPIGFSMESMETVYDLDVEVGRLCEELGLPFLRVPVVVRIPRFVRMIRELIEERLNPAAERQALGGDGPWPDRCPSGCCE